MGSAQSVAPSDIEGSDPVLRVLKAVRTTTTTTTTTTTSTSTTSARYDLWKYMHIEQTCIRSCRSTVELVPLLRAKLQCDVAPKPKSAKESAETRAEETQQAIEDAITAWNGSIA